MILSTSDSNRMKDMAKTGFLYLFISIFCILFGAVYEYFSHEVYSYFMLYAFAFPLVGGALLFFAMAYYRVPTPNRASSILYHSGIAALTIGSLFEGVLEIYGTTNRLVSVYWILGGVFILTSLVLYFTSSKLKNKNRSIKMENNNLDL